MYNKNSIWQPWRQEPARRRKRGVPLPPTLLETRSAPQRERLLGDDISYTVRPRSVDPLYFKKYEMGQDFLDILTSAPVSINHYARSSACP